MRVVGADGCRAGWVYVALDGEQGWAGGIAPNVRALWRRFQVAELILLDVPIGLKEHGHDERACDVRARRLLGARRSSVFPVPCRAAIYAGTYDEACRINMERTGRGLSKQAWNIAPLIRQVDELLRSDTRAREMIRESHPELAFWALNGGLSMAHYKATPEGEAERLALLRERFPAAEAVVDELTARYPRRDLDRHDVIDALALAVTASGWPEHITSIPLQPEFDAYGLRMEMVYGEVQLTAAGGGTDRILDTL